MRNVLISILALAGCDRGHPSEKAVPGSATDPSQEVTREKFYERRARHHTMLVKHGPSPQPYENVTPPAGVEAVTYRSGELELKAWYAQPKSDRPVPALVYLHGGFAFGADDFEDARVFLDAGFAVMTPSYRGENGNPGEFELYYGELDDVRAAINWVRARPGVDREHVYVFGHSAGGVLAAMTAFYPDTFARITGSSGGMYGPEALEGMEPFAAGDVEEQNLRVPAPNADQFFLPHFAFIGTEDESVQRSAELAQQISRRTPAPGRWRLLSVVTVPGDHFTSLAPAAQQFLELIRISLKSK